jgi:hypothetical protein
MGIVAGVSLGAMGVWQQIQAGNDKRWQRRVDALEDELSRSRSDARKKLDEDLEEISELGLQVKELRAELRARECPWPDGAGRARCYRADEPRAIEPDEVFERNQGAT